MAVGITLTIEGLDEVYAKLLHVGKASVQRRIIKASLRKAGTPYAAALRKTAPKRTGKLKKSVKTKVTLNPAGYPVAHIGSIAAHAHLPDTGTTWRTTKAGRSTGRVTGARFHDKAYRATKQQVAERLRDSILQGIDRELAKQATKKAAQ